MNALLVKFRLDNSILITGVGNGDENSARTLAFIPGSTMRGALVGLYLASRASKDLAADNLTRRLFFSGEVRFLNGFPELRGMRTLPTPASWRMDKHASLDDKPMAVDMAWPHVEEPETPKPVAYAFCRAEKGEPVEVFSPARSIRVHIGGEERGVVRADSNTVFRYEALAAGQIFTAPIIADDASYLDELSKLLKPDMRLALGGSRSAEYGQVTVLKVLRDPNWEETLFEEVPGGVTLTLLSDALLRDANGQPTLDLDAALSFRLGRTVKRRSAFVSQARVGGFNRQWELPLIQGEALAMGSVFAYETGVFSEAELRALSDEGIGERRAEGFGRVAVNWPTQADLTLRAPIQETVQPAHELSEASRALAKTMAERILRVQLDDALLEHSQRIVVERRPPNHQLSRLRTVVRKALAADKKPLQPITEYFGDENMREAARRLFERARVHAPQDKLGDRMSLWIQERAEKADGLVHLGVAEHRAPIVAGQAAKLPDELKREYTLRLIDAVLKGAMKANRRLEVER